MEQFKQRKFFTRKTFTFTEDGVDTYTKDIDGEFSKFIPFKDIEPRTKTRIYTEKYPRILQSALVILGVGLVRAVLMADDFKKTMIFSIIILALGLATLAAYYFIQIKYLLVELEDDSQMFIIMNSPDGKQFQAFVDELFERRKKNYRENYFFINYNSTREKEIGKMDWLKSEQLISEAEYGVVIDEINENLPN